MALYHAVLIFSQHLRAAMSKMGHPAPDIEFMRKLLEEAGFEDVKTRTAKEPLGLWPKDIRLKRVGAMSLLNIGKAFESYGMAAFTRVLGMDVEKPRGTCDAARPARQAARNKNYHVYSFYLRAYGRKPTGNVNCE
ncbi:hypothetical protein FPQ18DRAFT_147269 [Pyronema domesticum]|nr:hypothetical protein FPQ18DRAFT_147269 [Pyronema domesticum]